MIITTLMKKGVKKMKWMLLGSFILGLGIWTILSRFSHLPHQQMDLLVYAWGLTSIIVIITIKTLAHYKLLKNNEKFYKNLLSSMSEGVMIYRADHKKIVLNENVYDMFAVTEEDFPEQTIQDNIIPFIGEDGIPLPYEKYPVKITLETGKSLKGVTIGVKKKEKTTWLSCNTKLIDHEGVPAVLWTMSDITIQKEQEISLRESNALRRTLIDSLPAAIVFDNDLKIIAINRPLCNLFNINEPINELIGKNLVEYHDYFFKDLEGEEQRVMEVISKMESYSDELELNNQRTLDRRYFPFFIDKELKGHLWTFEDISERKLLEKGILLSKEEAEKANMAKSDFLSKMSHELRTPLNGILGFSQLLELDGSLSNQQHMFVQEILKGGRHLLSLINEILDLSRIESGKLKISKDKVNVESLILECINFMDPLAVKKGIRIITDFKHCTDIFVYLDPVRLRQIILNLLDNAIKYNKVNGEIFITIDCKQEAIVIHIIDNGIGIPLEEQSKIFEPFYRVTNSKVEGAGIGLPVVKQLVLLMGGDLGVESSEGQGSDFWFRLPIVQFNAEESFCIIESEMDNPPNDCKKTILYIEDNYSNIELVFIMLNREDEIKLLIAMTGEEGIEIAIQQPLDLILLDLNLPDMNGFEVLEKIKRNPKTEGIPVIALSANAMTNDINQALAKGFKDYITKPIDVKDFLRVVLE
jgi:signal transduction histidine kinase